MSSAAMHWIVGLIVVAALAAATPVRATPVGGGANKVVIWVPDYYGGKVYRDTITDASSSAPKVAVKSFDVSSCNPNAVAVQGDLYVVCNSDWGGLDQILVYDPTTFAHIRTITGLATDSNNYFSGSGLIAILFDSHGNLWVSGYNTSDLLRVPASQLTGASPLVDRQVIDSPDSPAGLAMDTDDSIWVVGQYESGIVVNFTDKVLNAPGTFLGRTALSPTPRYCMSNDADGCQQSANLFNYPEGVAVFDGSVWVSNNGGNLPAATIVRLVKHANTLTLTPTTFGSAVSKPFACPGGMFAAMVTGGTPTLWVNDEGYDVANTDCGSSGADQGDQIGRVLEFLPADLLQHKGSPNPEKFTGWNKIRTSSPGFGGIFVQMSQ